MMLSIAYVPLDDVIRVFRAFSNQAPEELSNVVKYFDQTYVEGKPARGRREAVAPRYAPELWNQRDAALEGSHKTNNVSEGWHNRFQVVVGKHHPDLYSALKELQKEEADTEIALNELALGKRVKASPKRKWITLQDRIKGIASRYDEYQAGNREMEYLRTLGHNIVL